MSECLPMIRRIILGWDDQTIGHLRAHVTIDAATEDDDVDPRWAHTSRNVVIGSAAWRLRLIDAFERSV